MLLVINFYGPNDYGDRRRTRYEIQIWHPLLVLDQIYNESQTAFKDEPQPNMVICKFIGGVAYINKWNILGHTKN